MSNGRPGDWAATQAEMKRRGSRSDAANHGKNWLRHGRGTEAAMIDSMLLEGRYSLDDMIDQLDEEFSEKKKTRRRWEKRIRSHFEHLQHSDAGQIPHNCKLTEIDGIWRFATS